MPTKPYFTYGPLRLHKLDVALKRPFNVKGKAPALFTGGCRAHLVYGVHGNMVQDGAGYNGWSWHPKRITTGHCRECRTERDHALSDPSERPSVCEWCGFEAVVGRQIERDHILPRKEGGALGDSNCQYLCANCHALKTHEDWVRFGWGRHD